MHCRFHHYNLITNANVKSSSARYVLLLVKLSTHNLRQVELLFIGQYQLCVVISWKGYFSWPASFSTVVFRSIMLGNIGKGSSARFSSDFSNVFHLLERSWLHQNTFDAMRCSISCIVRNLDYQKF